ncbi:MAG: hypothetical protein QXS76_00115 [Candidatus Bathyarchaeia archaeon]
MWELKKELRKKEWNREGVRKLMDDIDKGEEIIIRRYPLPSRYPSSGVAIGLICSPAKETKSRAKSIF